MAIGFPRFESRFDRQLERSGTLNERFVFGEVRTQSPDYQEDVQRLVRRTSGEHPITLADAVELVKRYQPFEPDRRIPQDPKNPVKQFPNALRREVARRLGHDDVFFWTGVGSILDKNFAADAVFETRRLGKAPRYVRLDASIDPDKVGEYTKVEESRGRTGRYATPKDDANFRDRIVIGEVLDVHEDPAGYSQFVRDIAGQIIEKLETTEHPAVRQK